MTLQIRSCQLDDFSSVFDLFKQLWPSLELDYAALHAVYERALSSATQQLIVGVQEDRIVGFCSLTLKNNFWKAGRIGNVDELVVDENYRGQGIGKKLMSKIEEIATGNQCSQIELDSSFHRKEAHRFYERIGYKSRAYLFTKPLAKMS
jgi:ribosomal protein S18 acetylase RimI-like enzyme